MKMKKVCIYIAIFAILIGIGTVMTVYALSENNTSSLSRAISEEQAWEVNRMEKIMNENQNISLSSLPVYSFGDLSKYVGSRGVVLNLSSIGNTLTWFNGIAGMKVDHIQKIDDDRITVVYRVQEQDIPEAYMLVVFHRKVNDDKNFEVWEKTGEAYFLNDLHGFNEFEEIKVGDSVEMLYTIDESIQYDVLRCELSNHVWQKIADGDISASVFNSDEFNSMPKMIYKIVKEGIMTIEYHPIDMVITEISFYSYEKNQLPLGVSAPFAGVASYFGNEKQ